MLNSKTQRRVEGGIVVTQWIEGCAVQRVSLHDGLVLNFDDYNELVISRPLRLILPVVDDCPAEDVVMDPADVPAELRPLLDFSGAVCTHAECDSDGTLHLKFATGHEIEVGADKDATAWELYGKRHGYMACLPGGEISIVRHDISHTR
jgi:hypothetical protein